MAKYNRPEDGYPTGAQWIDDTANVGLVLGVILLFLFPPLGVFLLIFSLFNKSAVPSLHDVETAMSMNVKGKGNTPETEAELAKAAGSGGCMILASFVLGALGLLFFL